MYDGSTQNTDICKQKMIPSMCKSRSLQVCATCTDHINDSVATSFCGTPFALKSRKAET